MPFTPFHFGPGLLLKLAAPRRISASAFVAAQVGVDVEPLWFMLSAEYPVHRALHTVVGGATIGLAVGLALWGVARSRAAGLGPVARAELSAWPAALGGLIGGASHALLDGFMHRDVHPLRPWSETQWLLGPVGVMALHAACLLAGVAGAVGLWMRRARG
jgi:membrane-bound metal-dependent hydrolase YbcI (DUF457 family)